MKLTVKRLFTGTGLFWIILGCLVLYSCHPVPANAAESVNIQAHCVTAGDRFGTQTTQCDDGTVTVTQDDKTTVCAKNKNGDMACQKL